MNVLANHSRLSRFLVLLAIGLILAAIVRWAVFGRPTADSLDGIVISAVVFALLLGFFNEPRYLK